MYIARSRRASNVRLVILLYYYLGLQGVRVPPATALALFECLCVIKLPRPYDTAVRQEIKNISFYLNCAGVGFPGKRSLSSVGREHPAHNREVAGSSPAGSTFHPNGCLFNQKISHNLQRRSPSVRI